MPSSLGQRCLSSATGNRLVKDGIHYRQVEKDFDPNFLYDFNSEHGSTVCGFCASLLQ